MEVGFLYMLHINDELHVMSVQFQRLLNQEGLERRENEYESLTFI